MQTKGRKHMSATIFAAAAFAMAVGAIAGPAVSQAREWDIGAYDNCMKNSTRPMVECCIISGGDFDSKGECGAPPAKVQTAPQTPTPGPVPGTLGTRPGQAKLP